MWVWLLPNELYYNVIHKESLKFLKELYQLGLRELGIIQNGMGLWLTPSPNYNGQKEGRGNIQMWTVYTLWKKKNGLKKETRNQGSKPKTMENHSQETEQFKELAICAQLDFIIAMDKWLPCASHFAHSWLGMSLVVFLWLSNIVCLVCVGRQLVTLVHGYSNREGPHPRSLLHTWAWFRW